MDENANAGSAHVGAALFQPISHPVLRSIDPKEVAKFINERKRYEDEVEEKKKEIPSLTAASYRISIERDLLESLHFLGHFESIAPGCSSTSDISSDHIKTYLEGIISDLSSQEVNPQVIEAALKNVRVQMSIEEPKARMTQFVSTIFKRLDGVGHGNFKSSNPKKMVKLIQERVYPANLRAAMAQKLEYSEALTKDVKLYVKALTEEAVIQDKINPLARNKGSSNFKASSASSSNSSSKPSSNKDTKVEPLCLYPPHAAKGIRHFMSKCDGCTDPKERQRLIDERRAQSKKQRDEKRQARIVKTGSLDSLAKDLNSVTINAVFAQTEERNLCADGGADINLLPPDLMSQLLSKGADVKLERFKNVRKFGLAAVSTKEKLPVYVSCDRLATMNVELRIRHGKALMLRNVQWYVAVEEMVEPLLGRPLLEALGLNTKQLLEAACDQHKGDVSVPDILPEIYSEGTCARRISNGVFHSSGKYEAHIDLDENDKFFIDIGDDTPEEISSAFNAAIQSAKINGISDHGALRLETMLKENRDIFRIRLGNDPAARVEPMKVELIPGSSAYVCKARRYSKEQRDFLDRYMSKLEEYGYMIRNSNSSWASAPLLVPKDPPAYYRLTFDLRAVNSRTVSNAWPMPNLESELLDFSGSTCFASIDFTSAYWQLPLDSQTGEVHSVMTPKGIMTPTRTLQGAKNSVGNFQSRIEPCFASLRSSMKAWLDDFAIHAKTEDTLLANVNRFLQICKEIGLKVSPMKSVFFTKELRWCGRVINEKGIRCDPRRLSGIKMATYPVTAGELCQYIHCLQWMSSCIPDFASRVEPLRKILESAYQRSGSRKKKSIDYLKLKDLGWEASHDESFDSLQSSLRDAVSLAHRDFTKSLCVFTDASDSHWASVVTQCEPSELEKDFSSQIHFPLCFLSSAFRNHEVNWSTYEKEGFAIYQVFKKMDFLLMMEEKIEVFTDHRNFLFVFNPWAVEPSLGRYVVTKVQRWALYLSIFQYTINHVPGEQNVMADIMSRWLSGYRSKTISARRVTELLEASDMIPNHDDEQCAKIDLDRIREMQSKFQSSKPLKAVHDSDGLIKLQECVWIPSDAHDLQLNLIVNAHCGVSGHRGAQSTLAILNEQFKWANMKEDVTAFVQSCIHCVVAKGGERVPRPLSSVVHGAKPNDLIHFDYLYMGPGSSGLKYLLVIKDDVSSYCWLCPTSNAYSEHTAEQLSRWIRTFTVMKIWASDQGSHFKNCVLKALANDYKVKQTFSVSYSPWVNGTVENLMQHILACCQALLSEFLLAPQDWPLVTDLVMTALNESPLKRLGRKKDGSFYSPLEVMTGLVPCRQQLFLSNNNASVTKTTVDLVKFIQREEILKAKAALDEMHKQVSSNISKQRAQRILLHNKRTNIVTPNFHMGDFVMVRKPDKKGHKNSFRWTGPRRISDIVSDVVYDVRMLNEPKTERVHASRMKLYRAQKDNSPSARLLAQARHLETRFELIEKLMDISEMGGDIYVHVQWQGLPDEKEWTWQELKALHNDVPEEVVKFLNSTKKRSLAKKAKKVLGLHL